MSDLATFAKQAEAACEQVRRPDIRDWLMGQPGLVQRWGTWVEFGVGGGGSFEFFAARRGRARMWGFDSFRGLPEDWNAEHPKGRFAEQRPPMPPEGCHYVVGLFEETLPAWSPPPITFVHVDCDLYRSALEALSHLWNGKLENGAVILLDDCFTAPLDNGVLRALHEAWGHWRKWEWIARAQGGDAAAIRVRM